MRKPKFKVGDKVKVLRASTEEEYDLWGDGWTSDMNRNIGKIMIIEYVYPGKWQEVFEYCKYSMKECGYAYPEFVLQKVNEVGKQLMFPFMETSD